MTSLDSHVCDSMAYLRFSLSGRFSVTANPPLGPYSRSRILSGDHNLGTRSRLGEGKFVGGAYIEVQKVRTS